ncbi:hypothetical protein AKJ09_04853 [Labilithrix luteola]|uniref:Uncharacterized protein n=1 Tax=Labilithrix luteola TaxID=1391654 RepID=A0A0K1PYG7_9BACT|nr:hypothetical protein AKJ09_04853 [Labilithrix luteola]
MGVVSKTATRDLREALRLADTTMEERLVKSTFRHREVRSMLRRRRFGKREHSFRRDNGDTTST